MFVRNIADKNILFRSFEGYSFSIPRGTSWIWDKAGEYLLSVVYPPSPINMPKADRFGNPNGNGIPPLGGGTKRDWLEEGKKLAEVKRFQVNHAIIPRKRLIPLAKLRGIDNDKITEWLADESIDASEISDAINALPIPEQLRFPEGLGQDEDISNKNDIED